MRMQVEHLLAIDPLAGEIAGHSFVKRALPHSIFEPIFLKDRASEAMIAELIRRHLVVKARLDQYIEVVGQQLGLEARDAPEFWHHRLVHVIEHIIVAGQKVIQLLPDEPFARRVEIRQSMLNQHRPVSFFEVIIYHLP